jgi:hypothetical protein
MNGNSKYAGRVQESKSAARIPNRAHLRQALLAGAMICTAVALHAQSGAKCPINRKLTLEQVVGSIQQKLEEEVIVNRIESCHVTFSLNAAALEKLSEAGASDAEMAALNRETVSQLTVEQAHAEVGGLERHVADSNKAVAAERDEALQKQEANYKMERAKAAELPAKGPFETTQEYNQRKQQAETALASMDAAHKRDAARMTAQYAAEAESKARLFQTRITFLEKAVYADTTKAANPSYDADKRQLTTNIGGEEYLFESVAPAVAKQVVPDWKDVSVAQPYAEDKMKTRVLRLKGSPITLKGELKFALTAISSGENIICPSGHPRGFNDDGRHDNGFVQFLDPSLPGKKKFTSKFYFSRGEPKAGFPAWIGFDAASGETAISGGVKLLGNEVDQLTDIRVTGPKDDGALAEKTKAQAGVALQDYKSICSEAGTREGEGLDVALAVDAGISTRYAVDVWGDDGYYRVDTQEGNFYIFDHATKLRIHVDGDNFYGRVLGLELYDDSKHRIGAATVNIETREVKISDSLPATKADLHEMGKALKAAAKASEYIDRITGPNHGSYPSEFAWSHLAGPAAAILAAQ